MILGHSYKGHIYSSNSKLFEKEGGGVKNFPLLHRGRNFLSECGLTDRKQQKATAQ